MRRWFLPVSLAACLAVLLSAGIQEMALYGHHGWSLARRGVAARNTLRHGLVATRLAPVESPGDTGPADFIYYANHPALTTLLVALAVGVLGASEWAERTVPILFTLAFFFLLHDLARRQRGDAFASCVALVLLAMPLVTYYGSFVNHEPIVLWAVTATVWSLEALRRGKAGALPALVTAVAIGALDDWSFYFVLGPLMVLAFVDGRRRADMTAFWSIALTGAVAFALVAIHAVSIPGETLRLFGERLEGRSTLNESFLEVLGNPAVPPRMPMLLTPFGAMAALVLPLMTLLRWRSGRACFLDAAATAIWIGAVAYSLLLSEGLRNHDYWVFLFAPCAALGLATLIEQSGRPTLTRVLILVPTLLWGLLALWDFRRLPSELSEEWPDFRFRENLVMRHVHRRTRSSESVLMEETVYMQHQARFYLDRRWEWFRGQLGLGDWARDRGASMIVLPAETAEGPSLAELGRHARLTAFEDHWIVDLREGPGAVDARRVVHRPASLAWRYLRSLVYTPYRVVHDAARSAELTTSLWARLGRPVQVMHPGLGRRLDMDARVARYNRGDRSALDSVLPVRVRGSGTLGEVLGVRLERGAAGSVEVWMAVRAATAGDDPPRILLWASGEPETAADRALLPRVPEAWWQPGRVYLYHRVLGLRGGRHVLFLRGTDDGLLGPTQDVDLGAVRVEEALPVLGRY